MTALTHRQQSRVWLVLAVAGAAIVTIGILRGLYANAAIASIPMVAATIRAFKSGAFRRHGHATQERSGGKRAV